MPEPVKRFEFILKPFGPLYFEGGRAAGAARPFSYPGETRETQSPVHLVFVPSNVLRERRGY